VASKAGEAGSVQSLSRAFSLLGRLAEAAEGRSLSDLAGAAALAPSTAHRLLNSMRNEGFVEFDEETGLWSVGLQAFAVGNAYLKKRDLVAQARPFMRLLVADTGETSNLGVLDGDHHVFLSQVESPQLMRMVARLGRPGPVFAAGVGKALLSALPEHDLESILDRLEYEALTKHTIVDKESLKKELALVRTRGFAVDDEEQALGLRCISANIYDEHAEAIAAVSISGPTVRVSEDKVGALGAAVVQTAAAITSSIGGVGPLT